MRTSYFDTDFASKMKLTNILSILCSKRVTLEMFPELPLVKILAAFYFLSIFLLRIIIIDLITIIIVILNSFKCHLVCGIYSQ